MMWALLVALLIGAAACGSTDVAAPAGARTGDAGAALAAGPAPRADQGHLGPGAIRCSNCHTAEQRGHAEWRETAMRLGHDVQTQLAERTTCHQPSVCSGCHAREKVGAGGGNRSPHPSGWLGLPGQPNDHGRAAWRDPEICAGCHGGAGEALCVGCHKVGGVGGNPHNAASRSQKRARTDRPCRMCHGSAL